MKTLEDIMDYINSQMGKIMSGDFTEEERKKYLNMFLDYVDILEEVIMKTEDLKYRLWRCIKLLNKG